MDLEVRNIGKVVVCVVPGRMAGEMEKEVPLKGTRGTYL